MRLATALHIALLGLFSLHVKAQEPFPAEKAKKKKPHVLLVLADDLGYGNVGWNRKYFGDPSDEVITPEMDKLVEDGVHLTRFYVHHSCGPTRSALQSGRLPIHVCDENADPAIYNEHEASGVGAGIPRNMTGVAQKMRSGGYRTHMVGKWDAGMATPTHTPVGRGYESQLCYFHHANSYWNYGTGGSCGVGTDLYDTNGPAYGMKPATQHRDHRNISAYEEYIFEQRALSIIDAHDTSEPLFLFYAAHLVHLAYEVPDQYRDKLYPFVDNSSKQGDMRLSYAAMVNFLDGVVGNLTQKLKDRGMWEDTLMIFLSDNGGPIYAGGNNYPLRGGKYSEFEGGIRSAAFASGGMIPESLRGTVHNGLGSVADLYTTLSSIAGIDPTDGWAAAAGLPAVDGLDLSDMLMSGKASPRTEVATASLHDNDLKAWAEYDYWHPPASAFRSSGGEDVDNGGWCKQFAALPDVKKIRGLQSDEECWQACRDEAQCMQANFETAPDVSTQCFFGGNNMTIRPQQNRDGEGRVDHCYAKYGFGSGPAPTPSPTPTPPPTPPSPSPTPSPSPSPSPTPKQPACWKVQACDLLDKEVRSHEKVSQQDCCKLCAADDACPAAVWEPDDGQSSSGTGTCSVKMSAKQQIVSFLPSTDGRPDTTKKICFLDGTQAMPPPIVFNQASIVVGDMKLVTGNQVQQAVFTGPVFPNASTPWTIDGKTPNFDCSTPYKIGCLFNVTADPTEHNDLAETQWDDAKRLLDRLLEISKTWFNPDRGETDQRACKQMEELGNWYGPWLELDKGISEIDAVV